MSDAFKEKAFIWQIDGRHYAFPLSSIVRVVMSVALVPCKVPQPFLKGWLNYAQVQIPAFDIRAWLGLSSKEVTTSDLAIIFSAAGKLAACFVDNATGIKSIAELTEATKSTLSMRNGKVIAYTDSNDLIFLLRSEPIVQQIGSIYDAGGTR
jgi:chemotaxis signal transduction protein